jgi:hypothetical protein
LIDKRDSASLAQVQFYPAWFFKSNALKAQGRVEETDAALAKAKELGYRG